jgi:hypothetical protein
VGTAVPQIPRLRSSRPAIDSDGFFDAVGQAIQLHINTTAPPDGASPFYVHEFPKERLSKTDAAFDGVTFRVLSSVPAASRNDGTIPRKPYEFSEPDLNQANYVKKTTTWFELLSVEFTLWSKSSPTRGKLVNWFHKFMMRYANAYKFFEARGADQFQFVGRGEDGFETREEQEIYYGTLTYQVRVQFLDTYSERQLTQLTVDSQLGNDQQTILQTA